jgi:tetratricopeptide (TPR) repeat protein
MPLDPYVSCPCGSGKKFKWCCAPYFPQVEKAFELERQNQHEAALSTIRELTKTHADKPPVWGYFAQFLYNSGMSQRDEATRNAMLEQAEEALSQALKLNPNLGMAHFLRGQFRENEGEVIGALLLYRRAAESYDPEAHNALTNVYLKIYTHETMLNRPVAARAALERAVHFQPAEADLRQQLETEYGEEGALPEAARKKYTFRPTAKPVSAALATGRFGDARKAFEELTQLTPDDPAAWFNLGVVLAWMGEQPRAVEALLQSIELETDDHRAEEAGALAEVLRCGHGMEQDTDHVTHAFMMPIRDPNAVMNLLRAWEQSRRLRNMRAVQETGMLVGLVVEELPSLIAVGSTTLARVTAKIMIANGVIRLTHPNRGLVAAVAEEARNTLQLAVEQPQETTNPIAFVDVTLDAIAQPVQSGDVNAVETKMRDYTRNFFENTWMHRPLRSLNGNTPLDAVGSSILRKRLFGVIKFLADCLEIVTPQKQVGDQVVPIQLYDFAALRHKLSLEYISAPPPKVNVPAEPKPAPAPAAPEAAAAPPASAQPTAPATPAAPAKPEIGAMNVGELAALDQSKMSLGELEQAMRVAIKLDARELAVSFAQSGLQKPFDPAKPDRYPLYAAAITGASAAGDLPKAVELAEQGEKYDAEHNGAGRAMEFALKKAQLFVKMKNVDRAATAFDGIIAQHPEEGKFYTTAAEDMLRLKSGAKALYFAERGLAKAKETGNRDLAGHCEELIGAAKKAM